MTSRLLKWISVVVVVGAAVTLGFRDVQATKKADNGWFLGSFAIGGGYGQRPDVGYGEPSPGLYMSYELGSLGGSIPNLAGVGAGITFFEGRLFDTKAHGDSTVSGSAKITPASFFPIYAYYPVLGHHSYSEHYVYLFCGGSLWSFDYKYLHAGVTLAIANYGGGWGGPEHVFLRIKMGGYLTSGSTAENGRQVDGRWMLYISIDTGFGGMMFRGDR